MVHLRMELLGLVGTQVGEPVKLSEELSARILAAY